MKRLYQNYRIKFSKNCPNGLPPTTTLCHWRGGTSEKKYAFTLAETLITLVIIGVVAALTVPSLIAKYKEEQTISKLKSSYSTFSQALKMAELHNGKVETWDLGTPDSDEGALKLYNYIAPEIQKLKECKSSNGCFADNYKNLQGENVPYQPDTWLKYKTGVLNNGVPFLIWSGGTDCTNHWGNNLCGSIRVDLNGNKKPNRYGYDFFNFNITKQGLIPGGTTNTSLNTYCNHSGNHVENGLMCTAWVLYKNNFDYKHKNISW